MRGHELRAEKPRCRESRPICSSEQTSPGILTISPLYKRQTQNFHFKPWLCPLYTISSCGKGGYPPTILGKCSPRCQRPSRLGRSFHSLRGHVQILSLEPGQPDILLDDGEPVVASRVSLTSTQSVPDVETQL